MRANAVGTPPHRRRGAVTARIRRKSEAAPATELPAEPEPVSPPAQMQPVEAVPAHREEPPKPAAILPLIEMPSASARMEPAYRQQVARGRRQNDRQLSLF